MINIKRIFLVSIAIFIIISAGACSKSPEIPTTHQIILALCENEIDLPAGNIYSSDFDMDSKNYLTDTLLSAYLGEPDTQKYKSDWISYSIFIPSGKHVCEFAAIYCSTPESVIDTAKLLLSRLDSIKKHAADEFSSYIEQARVITRGNYVLLIISSDTQSSIKVAKKVC